jgi:hypothetical protein
MGWSRALLKDCIQLCKSAKKKIISTLSNSFYFLTSSKLDCTKIDIIALTSAAAGGSAAAVEAARQPRSPILSYPSSIVPASSGWLLHLKYCVAAV